MVQVCAAPGIRHRHGLCAVQAPEVQVLGAGQRAAGRAFGSQDLGVAAPLAPGLLLGRHDGPGPSWAHAAPPL